MTEGLQEAGLVTWPPLVATRRSSDRRPLVSLFGLVRRKRASRLGGLPSDLLGPLLWSGLHHGLLGRAWPATRPEERMGLLLF